MYFRRYYYKSYRFDTNQCLKSCEIESFINQNCITDDLTENNQMNNINNIRKAIEDHSIDYLLDNITKGGNDLTIVEKNIKYQISSSWNQNNIDNENISNVKLGKCEDILKEKYNISSDVPLLIFKLDIDIEGYLAPSIEYEIYNPITKEKLDLKYCQDEQINISIPVNIDENELFLYNPKSEFYNDICTTYTTNFKTDISLKDRQKEFLNKNKTLCEGDCNYASYNFTLKKVECNCDAKYKIIGFFHNFGSYILLSIIFLYIVSLIYFILKDYSSLKREIIKTFFPSQKNNDKKNIQFKKNENQNNIFSKKASYNIVKKGKFGNKFKIPPTIFQKYKKNNKIISYNQKQNKKKNKSIDIIKKSNSKMIKKVPKIILTEFELNNSLYTTALLYDKRTFWKYFFSLLKFEHLLFFAIIPSKDYNSKAIKICIFLFTFALFFANNTIFMNEDAIHNIYQNQGTFDLIYQIPQIIYSNIISFIIDKIIRYLSLSQDYVVNEKMKPIITTKNKIFQKVFRVMLVKFIFFFIK